MARTPQNWEETGINVFDLGEPIGRAFGFSFFEHPTLGDESTVLAVTLDCIGSDGPVVWDTLDMDIPEYL